MDANILNGKCVLVGVSGGIAAYKAAILVSKLLKLGADVEVIMTENATGFIAPLTFSTYTGHRTMVDTFDEGFEYRTEHIAIAKKADIAIVAPATANVIAKMAHGLADDMLTTTLLATKAPVIVAPAMNTAMYENPATKANLETLRSRGIEIVDAAEGMLACGDEGAGRMPEPEILVEYVLNAVGREKLLAGKNVLVAAGPTMEPIDPVRFITNHSTGKMGYAIAREAVMMGADVTLISGPVNLLPPIGCHLYEIRTASEMYTAVMDRFRHQDIIVMAAAVADFTPANPAEEKIKKGESKDSELKLVSTKDILKELGSVKDRNAFLCGFAMETEKVLENAKAKLKKKGADMIVANSLREEGAGFKADTNHVTLITKEGEKELPMLSKDEVAYHILSDIAGRLKD